MTFHRFLPMAGAALLVVALAVPPALADGSGENLYEQMQKRKLKRKAAQGGFVLFDILKRPRKPSEVKVVSVIKPRKPKFNNPKPVVVQPTRLSEPLPSYGNLVYVPEKLEPLRAAKLEAPVAAEPGAAAIFAELTAKTQAIRVTPDERKAIIAAYEMSGFKPFWVNADGLGARGQGVLAILAAAEEEGLSPADYLPQALGSYADSPAVHQGDALHLARLDLGLTAAALAYARHASSGRIIPDRLTSYNDISPVRADPVAVVKLMQYSPFPDAYLKGLQPKHPAYAAFKSALADLRVAWAEGADEPIPSGKRINPGKSDPRVALVRARLERMGLAVPEPVYHAEGLEKLSAQSVPGTDAELLDEKLSDVLKGFQKKSSLKQTGAIDTLTVKALNRNTAKQDISRLVLNMDRLRWLPKDLGVRHVFVNQAAFEAEVMDHGKEVWRTRVVVGKSDTQTVAFHDMMETVVFNPSWGIPQSIMTNEMLPILRRDPTYLDRKGFEVFDKHGKKVKSASVKWASYGDKVPFTFYQPPGEDNALGEIKFLFPNRHDIYMHDTPSRALFQRPVRAFSHGCVRVQDPRKFAELVAGLSAEEIGERIASGTSQSFRLKQKLPVHITYFTAWPLANGRIAYFDDVYGRDVHMEEALGSKTVALR